MREEMFLIPYSMQKIVEKIDFRESVITNVEYDHDSLCTIVSLSFCNWKQEGYLEYEPKMIDLYLEFSQSFLLMDSEMSFNEKMGKIHQVEYVEPETLRFVFASGINEKPVAEFRVFSDDVYLRERKPHFDTYNVIIAESEHYAVLRFYEDCILVFKDMSRGSVSCGDFYGDAEFAMIDKNEKFVVTGGCGLIIYRIREPFEYYMNDRRKSDQWIEIGIGRTPEEDMYYDAVEQIGDNKLRIVDANGEISEFEFDL